MKPQWFFKKVQLSTIINIIAAATLQIVFLYLLFNNQESTLIHIQSWGGRNVGHPRYEYIDLIKFFIIASFFIIEGILITAIPAVKNQPKGIKAILSYIAFAFMLAFVLLYFVNMPTGVFYG